MTEDIDMKVRIILITTVFILLSFNNAFGVKILDVQDKDDDSTRFSRYEIFNEAVTWKQAKTRCEELGGHLATITSKEEYNTVLELLPKNERHLYWLGATDSEREGKWKWITGEPFIFTQWHKGEPNDEFGQEDFLNLTNYWSPYNNQWGWNDENGNRVISGATGFICEYETQNTSSSSKKFFNVSKGKIQIEFIGAFRGGNPDGSRQYGTQPTTGVLFYFVATAKKQDIELRVNQGELTDNKGKKFDGRGWSSIIGNSITNKRKLAANKTMLVGFGFHMPASQSEELPTISRVRFQFNGQWWNLSNIRTRTWTEWETIRDNRNLL